MKLIQNTLKKPWIYMAAVGVGIAFVAYGAITTTTVGRLELTHPDYDVKPTGNDLHTVVRNEWTKISNNIATRYEAFSGIADSGTVNHRHALGVAFDELTVKLYTGTYPNLTRVADPAGAGYTIAVGSPAKEVIDITAPGSGGPHTFAVQVVPSTKLDEMTDVDVSTTAPEDGQALVFDTGSGEWIPGASGDSSFKCQAVSDPNLTIKSGYLILDSGVELQIASDLTVSLDTVLGGNPADATAYYLYGDLDQIPAATTLANGRQVRVVSLASHFSLQTALPDQVSLARYVPLCVIKSATTGNVWSGAGSDFATLATRRHQSPSVSVSPVAYSLTEQAVGSVGSAGQLSAGHVLTDDSFPAYTTDVSYYNLGDVNDDSTNSRPFTNNGSIVFNGTDILGNGSSTAVFDGVDDSLTSTDAHLLLGDNNFTVGGWFASTDWASTAQMLFGNHDAVPNQRSFYISITGTNKFEIQTSTNGSAWESQSLIDLPSSDFTSGAWHHIVLRFNDTANTLDLFIDGQKIHTHLAAGDIHTPTTNFRIGAYADGTTQLFSGVADEFFVSRQTLSDFDIRKLYSYRIDHNSNVLQENQEWSAQYQKSDDSLTNYLDKGFVVDARANSVFIDLGLSATDKVALSMKNNQLTTNVVPVKTFTTGLLSSAPSFPLTHNLGAQPKDFYVLVEGASLSGDFDKRYDLCSADATQLQCDLSSLTIDGTHRVEIVASAAPIAVSVPVASASVSGIVSTSAQTFAGLKTFNDGIHVGSTNPLRITETSINNLESNGKAINIETDSAHDIYLGTNGSTQVTVNGTTGETELKVRDNGSGGIGTLYSGVFTPTEKAGTNCSSSSIIPHRFMRVGNVVTVSGQFDLTTTASTTCTIDMDLPINTSATNRLTGTAVSDAGSAVYEPGYVIWDSTTSGVRIILYATTTGARNFTYHYTYEIQ